MFLVRVTLLGGVNVDFDVIRALIKLKIHPESGNESKKDIKTKEKTIRIVEISQATPATHGLCMRTDELGEAARAAEERIETYPGPDRPRLWNFAQGE